MFGNQLKKQAQLRESILAIVVIVVLCYAGYSTFYAPKKARVDELKTKIAELTDKAAGLKKLTSTLSDSNKKINEQMQKQAEMHATQDPRIQMIQKYKDPIFKSVSSFLNAITQEEFRRNVSIESLKYDMSVQKKGYSETRFVINAFGKFTNVIEFIQKLEGVPALVTLENINVSIHKKDANMVSIDFTGTFYQLGNDNG